MNKRVFFKYVSLKMCMYFYVYKNLELFDGFYVLCYCCKFGGWIICVFVDIG